MNALRRRASTLAVTERIAAFATVGVLAYFVVRELARFFPRPGAVLETLRHVSRAVQGSGEYSQQHFTAGVSWLLLAAAMAGLPLLLCALRKVRRAAPANGADVPRLALAFALRFGLIALLVGCSYLIKRMDLTTAYFSYAGRGLVWYSMARIGLVFCLGVVCVGFGSWIAERIDGESRVRPSLRHAIPSFFLGATACAAVAVFLGYVGLLKALLVLPLFALGAWVAAPRVYSLLGHAWVHDRMPRGLEAPLAGATVALTAWIGVSYALFPVTPDNDVWEHYLHYYREVLQQGSLGPNDVWYHYYLSKGAGLFFAAATLSDVFAPQLVTLLMMAAIGAIIYDMAARSVRSPAWAWFAVVVFAASVYARDHSGAFFKHHSVFFAYAAFLVWCVFRTSLAHAASKSLVVAALAAAGYMGFYLPSIAMLLLFPMLALCALFYRTVQENRPTYLLSARAAAAAALGAVAAVALNYLFTGLGEMVPIRTFWNLADQSRFDELIGSSGALFFYAKDNWLPAERSLSWMIETLRIDGFGATLAGVTVGFAVVSGLALAFERPLVIRGLVRGLVPLAALAVPAIALAWYVQIHSVQRLYGFMALILSMLSVWSLWLVVVSLSSSRRRRLTGAAVLLAGTLAAAFHAVDSAGDRLAWAARFAAGKLSLEAALKRSDRSVLTQLPVEQNEILQARSVMRPGSGILALTYEPSFAYFAPGPGVVSEPSYTTGPRYSSFFSEPLQATRRRLQTLRADYFILNLDAPIFSAFAFTDLFAPESMAERFRIIYSSRDVYVLQPAELGGSPLPERLPQVFELKRSGAIRALFRAEFAEAVDSIVETSGMVSSMPQMNRANKACDTSCLHYAQRIRELVHTQLDGKLRMESNQALARRIETRIAAAFRSGPPRAVPPRSQAGEVNTVRGSALAAATVAQVREIIENALTDNFGPAIAQILISRDERYPFLLWSQPPSGTAARL